MCMDDSNRQQLLPATTGVDVDVALPTVVAQPHDACQCPRCKVWIYVAAGPFADEDPTKEMATWLHWRDEHLTDEERRDQTRAFAFPLFDYNEQPVEAIRARGRSRGLT
jgi:hypothetical protein